MSNIQSGTASKSNLRWAILCMTCITMTGTYYSFDIPAALHQQIKDYMSTSSTSASPSPSTDGYNYSVNFNLLYSVYSIPNIILPFFGGTIVDQLGAPTCTILFAILTLLGQLLFATGASQKSWNMMFLGRMIYGLGGENISVATSTLNSKWFQGKELALAFGINLAVSRLGSVVNNLISPRLANERGVEVSIWFGAFMNLISVFCAVVICIVSQPNKVLEGSVSVDVGAAPGQEQQLGSDSRTDHSLTEPLLGDHHGEMIDDMDEVENDPGEGECFLEGSSFSLNRPVAIDNVDNDGECIHSDESTVVATNVNDDDDDDDNDNDEEFEASSLACLYHVKKFSVMFWLLSASCIVVYGCVLPFNNIASGILLERNYFIKPVKGQCKLKYPNQCTLGILTPSEGNPALDSSTGNACPTKEHTQPLLPTTLHFDRGEDDDWDNETYHFDQNLTEEDVDCGDSFWKDYCTSDFCDAQGSATETSGRIMSIPYMLSALLSPFCGHVVDKVGFRAVISCVASLILICVHLSLALTDVSPVLPLIGQGLAYTCYAAVIWPSVPLTVSEGSVGTAFGAITAIQNLGLAGFPIAIAAIYTASGETYVPNVEYFFVVCAIIGTALGVMLNAYDRRQGGRLNKR